MWRQYMNLWRVDGCLAISILYLSPDPVPWGLPDWGEGAPLALPIPEQRLGSALEAVGLRQNPVAWG